MKECQLCKNCFTDDVNTCPNDGMPTFHSISGEPILDGKYQLECRLGQGGMGVVYKARHSYLKTSHAIKIILPDLVGNDPELVTRFRQEALAAAAIRHQNVVGVSDYGIAEGTMPFLVMEYVEGESLHDLLGREKILSPERAFELMAAIAAGVGAAHQLGIVHRDLKPLNVMIVKGKSQMSQAVKILDFGLAKIKSGELLGSFIQAQTTGLMGSPFYMAPELWADEEPNARSDVYSLGVMLFQMLAGNVPFKGSSIPAIMKKHLTDSPPPFSDYGVKIAPQIEIAVRHTLEKNPAQRTQSVDQLVEELKTAIGITSQSLHMMDSFLDSSMTVSNVSILTNPPQSDVFVDNVSVGQSQMDGWLMLEGLQIGNHNLRVSHDGFHDWEDKLLCDGKPKQVVAELKSQIERDTGAIPKPAETMLASGQSQLHNSAQYSSAPQGLQTANQSPQNTWQTAPPDISIHSQPKKSNLFSPLYLTIIGISGLLFLAIVGVGGAFMTGLIGRTDGVNINSDGNLLSNGNNQADSSKQNKNEMIAVTGGVFRMGRSDGEKIEQPVHEVTVKSFLMDKTEVTNAEFYDFVKETGYEVTPVHWLRGKPVPGEEKMPVRFVNVADAEAFAAWRSKRDGVTYRLPTEEEWEYAARNGGSQNLYPWGDRFETGCAVIERPGTEPEAVGSKPCGANKVGIMDLIGNVNEWTSSKASLYPGSEGELKDQIKDKINVFRGGSAFQKISGKGAITSTYRGFVEASKRDASLGFRLVRNQ
jgi:serine/threonine-protein kinase